MAPIPICVSILKNLLDPQVEEAGEPKRERQGRVMLARLDRIHRLPRNAEAAAKLSLAPPAFGTQDAKFVVHDVSETHGCLFVKHT
jgi:chemotaxis response regulator CheB